MEPDIEKNRKTLFYWASIAGADLEPVEVIEDKGRKGVLTTGCADVFWLDDVSAGVVLYDEPFKRPENPETAEKREARTREYLARRERMWAAGLHHGWRGPR